MPTGAYLRYSSDEQRPTSIDDQLRNCEAIAAKEGLSIDSNLRFADEAITGKAEGTSRRTGYRRLLDAIEARECTVLIADELSRITRHYSEGARLIDIVEKVGLRVITGDGIDTAQKNWKMMWMFKLMSAVQEVENSSDRTSRGMIGALIRGYQIAPPPYGYRAVREQVPGGKMCMRWVRDEKESEIVRTIFRLRRDGLSLVAIATHLKEKNVLPPRYKRAKGVPYWRPGGIFRLLSNTIYRGLFVWNGSVSFRAQARKRRATVETLEFGRESCRIVSDDDWYECNKREASRDGQEPRAPRAGGQHLFTGLVRCGDCHGLLCIGGGPKSFSLHCPECETANRIGGRSSWIGYSSVGAARQAIEFGLSQLFTGEVLQEFHRRLKDRLLSGPAKEEKELREKESNIQATVSRLKSLMSNPQLDPELFQDDMVVAADQLRIVRKRLDTLKEQVSILTPAVLEAQTKIEPMAMLHAILNGELEVYKVRATLRRLMSSFELIARPRPGCSLYRIEFVPGVCVAELTSTPVIDSSTVAFEIEVTAPKRRPVQWVVSGKRV